MTYFLKRHKMIAWVVMLTFLFSMVMPTNLAGTVANAATAEDNSQIANVGGNNKDRAWQTYEDGKVQVKKTIEKGKNENEFEITLDVMTTQNVEEIPEKIDTAVVLVFDCSSSMLKKADGSNDTPTKREDVQGETRIDASRAAAQAFIEAYANSAGKDEKRLFAAIQFGTDATILSADSLSNKYLGYSKGSSVGASIYNQTLLPETLTWYDVAATKENNDYSTVYNNVVGRIVNDNITPADGSVNGTTSHHGTFTNTQAGLQLAADIITEAKAEGGALADVQHVTVILLTDGLPTTTIQSGTGNPYRGAHTERNYSFASDANNAIAAANNVKGVADEFYVVGLAANETGKYYKGDNTQSDHTTQMLGEWLKDSMLDSDSSHFFGIENSTESMKKLAEALERISKQIHSGADAWTVTDPMTEYILYTGDAENSANGNNAFKYSNGTLTWDLKKSTPTTIKEETTTKYSYSLTYPVRLKNTVPIEGIDFTDNDGLDTNDTTVLDYLLWTSSESYSSAKHDTVNFNVPKVYGYEGTLEFTKVDAATKEALLGATFELKLADEDNTDNWSQEATSDENGKVKFKKIPSGHTYTLTETKAPTGYVTSDDSWTVNVDYGKVTIEEAEDEEAEDEFVVINERDTVTISGTKTWVDDNNAADARPDSITVELFRDGKPTGKTTTASAADWTYCFDNLPKYAVAYAVEEREEADGHEYRYTVQETPVDNYVATYKVGENGTIDIINTYVNPSEVLIQGQKHWVGGTKDSMPESITVKLIRTLPNSEEEEVTEQIVTAKNNWAYKFGKLPKYDPETKINYVYRVEEVDVPGYTSKVIGYDIINVYNKATLGDFAVFKTVTGNTAPEKFQFNLTVKATLTTANEKLKAKAAELEQKVEDADKELEAANEKLKYQKELFATNTKVATGSEYQYVLNEADASGVVTSYAVTSPSELVYELEDCVQGDEDVDVDADLLANIINAILELAKTVTEVTTGILQFMPVDIISDGAIVMNLDDVQALLKAQIAVNDAQAALDEAEALFGEVSKETTTPAAITVTMTPDVNGQAKGLTERVEKPELTEDGVYEFTFELFADTGYSFDVEATTGAEVTYEIVEVVDTTDTNYQGTLLNNQELEGPLTTGEQKLANKKDAYVYTNKYATSSPTPDPDPDPFIPDTPEKKEEKPPVVPIPDPEVPQGEPEVIPEEDVPLVDVPGEEVVEVVDTPVPLGDAPAMGDSSNALAFALALLAAGFGLVVTRRKFN